MNPHTEASVTMEHFPPLQTLKPSLLPGGSLLRLSVSPTEAKKCKPINIDININKAVVKTRLVIKDGF